MFIQDQKEVVLDSRDGCIGVEVFGHGSFGERVPRPDRCVDVGNGVYGQPDRLGADAHDDEGRGGGRGDALKSRGGRGDRESALRAPATARIPEI